jgi:tetratricopeptide (TPR) repeat protein
MAVTACTKSDTGTPTPAPAPATPPPAPAEHGHGGPPATLAEWANGAKLFDKLGTFHRAVTTSSPDAQKYFDQGMRWLWAFNHDESTRSFAKAAALDPACASCYWGAALTIGPNYNMPIMAAERATVAADALGKAQQNAAKATPVERALIAALAKRYNGAQPLDPSNTAPLFTAYANAMRAVAKQYPDDMDVQVMFAESLMNINPWKLWSADGKAAANTPEIQSTLERVLAKNPEHPGANHYYIHTMEASLHPERALQAAGRLDGMMPDAGHMEHMPAHILHRVGEYEASAQSNRQGVKADLAYLGATQPIDYYPMYLAHNYQFLAFSASMAGRKAETIDAAKKMKDALPVEALLAMPGLDWYVSEYYMTMIRFGEWDALLAEPAPDARLGALTAGYHFARAVALAEKSRVADAKAELAQLDKIAKESPADAGAGLNMAKDVYAVAQHVALGEIAKAEGKTDEAIAHLKDAAAKEDMLSYDEPSDWFFPVRHQLGALLLKAGKAADAEKVYRDDLARHPKNGWALFGLAQALRAQKKDADAAKVDEQFKDAWRTADVKISGSMMSLPQL